MNFIDVVNATLSPDDQIRNQAEAFLNQKKLENFGEYLCNLGAIIEDGSVDLNTKIMGGILFKRACQIPESLMEQNRLLDNYRQLSQDIRDKLKTVLINILRIEDISVLKQSPYMALGGLIILEMNAGGWPSAIAELTHIIQIDPSMSVRAHFLRVLCHICEEIQEDFLTTDTLKPIIQCILNNLGSNPSIEFKLASITTFYHIIPLCDDIFIDENSRNIVVSFMCQSTQDPDDAIKIKSLESIHQFVSCFYQYLGTYINVFEDLSLNEMNNIDQDVDIRFQAIEFWCTLCETEEGFIEDDQLFANYIKTAISDKSLLIKLFNIMQEENSPVPQKDSWNPKAAATVCMNFIANLLPQDYCSQMINPVLQGIGHDDYKVRDASLLTLGTMIEYDGLSQQTVQTSLEWALKLLAEDPVLLIKDTAAWLLCQILEHQFHYISESSYELIISLLLSSLSLDSSISIHCSSALYKFSESIGYIQSEIPQNNALSVFFEKVVVQLFQYANVEDPTLANLRESSFEALNSWIKNTGELCNSYIVEIYIKIKGMVNDAVRTGLSQGNRDLIARYISCLHTIIMRFSNTQASSCIINNQAELMELFLKILSNDTYSVAHQDTFLAIGSLSGLLKQNFKPYVPQLNTYINRFLTQNLSDSLMIDAICLISDLSTALEDDLMMYSELYMGLLHRCLTDPDVSQQVKPLVFTTIGDIAFAIKNEFSVYIPSLQPILETAANAKVDDEDEQWSLLQSVIECIIGIVNGLQPDKYAGFWDVIVVLLSRVAKSSAPPTVLKHACGLIGDLVRENHLNKTKFMNSGTQIKNCVECLISYGRKNNESKENADYALSQIR